LKDLNDENLLGVGREEERKLRAEDKFRNLTSSVKIFHIGSGREFLLVDAERVRHNQLDLL
jgi:hypothetical protein